jgi:hypothetical protein
MIKMIVKIDESASDFSKLSRAVAPENHIYREAIFDELAHSGDVVSVARHDRESILTSGGKLICISGHRGDDASVDFFLFIPDVAVLKNHFESRPFGELPDTVIGRWARPKQDGPFDLRFVVPTNERV